MAVGEGSPDAVTDASLGILNGVHMKAYSELSSGRLTIDGVYLNLQSYDSSDATMPSLAP